MTYTKPEIAVLGDAVRLIQLTGEKDGTVIDDGVNPRISPAYDLDE